MFEVYIESEDFRGKRLVMQHKMVTEVSDISSNIISSNITAQESFVLWH